MEYYLVRLAYTQAALSEMVARGSTLDERLAPVRSLIRHLGGSLASYGFFNSPHFENAAKGHVVADKFMMFGEHDILTILAVPDRAAAQAFNLAVASEPGVKSVELTAMMPLDHAVASMKVAREAVAATGYAAPGRAALK